MSCPSRISCSARAISPGPTFVPGGFATSRNAALIDAPSVASAFSIASANRTAASKPSDMNGELGSPSVFDAYRSWNVAVFGLPAGAPGAVPKLPLKTSRPRSSNMDWLFVPSTNRNFENSPLSDASRRNTPAVSGYAIASRTSAPSPAARRSSERYDACPPSIATCCDTLRPSSCILSAKLRVRPSPYGLLM